jgi:hypothetical protein
MTQKQAVLTGDLVNSTALARDQLELAFSKLTIAANTISRWQSAPSHFSRYRGDGWQMVLTRPELALRAALFLAASIGTLGPMFATRIAIGCGEVMPSSSQIPFAPAYVAAGHALDTMHKKRRIVHAQGGAISATTALADHIAKGWTPAQCTVLALSLSPHKMTHADMAKTLGITRQSVEKSLAAAGFPAIETALSQIEAADD